jgi:hypothetical protein
MAGLCCFGGKPENLGPALPVEMPSYLFPGGKGDTEVGQGCALVCVHSCMCVLLFQHNTFWGAREVGSTYVNRISQ